MCIAIVCCPVCDVINFEIYFSFLILHNQKSQDKNVNILRTKRAVKMKERTLFLIFKGLSLKQIKPTSLEGESPTLRSMFCLT